MFKEQKMFYNNNLFLAGRRASVMGATGDDVVFPPNGRHPGVGSCWLRMVSIYPLLCRSIYRLTLSRWFRRRVEPVATLVPVQVTIAMKYVAVSLASYIY